MVIEALYEHIDRIDPRLSQSILHDAGSVDELAPKMDRIHLRVSSIVSKLLRSGNVPSCVCAVRVQPEGDLLQVFSSASFLAATKRSRRS